MNPQKTVLYVLGGYGTDDSTNKLVSRYDPETDSWNTLPTKIPSGRRGFGCVSIKKDIFVIGGTDGSCPTDTILKLNTENGEWSELPPMKCRRLCCSAGCSPDGKYIYVAGGWGPFDDWDCSTVERFSIETSEWTTVKPMGVGRDYLELIELGGFLYALGGSGKSAERYDSETDQWSPIAEMKYEHRCDFGAAVLDRKIYVLGENGFEMYSPEEDRWTELPVPTFRPRRRKFVAFNGELLALGGMMSNGPVKNEKTVIFMKVVESFDVEKQIWSRKPDMDIGRFDPGVAVVNE